MTPIEQQWAELLAEHDRPIFRRIDDLHPLDLYVGIDIGDARVLMLVSDQKPPELPTFEVIEITSCRRADERWALLIRLKKQELVTPFSRLCQDLVDASRGGSAGVSPAAFLLRRLTRWHKLLQLDRSGLSDAEARGLIGELLFLEHYAIPGLGLAQSVDGWVGPEDAPQDFRIAGKLIEVKTSQLGFERVLISGVGQLDALGPLYLVVVTLAPALQARPQTITLCRLVQQVRSLVEVDAAAAAQFELRLAAAGFADTDKAAGVEYSLADIRAYRVRDSFPRITAANTPAGVIDVRYAIDLHLCSEFQCDLGELSSC